MAKRLSRIELVRIEQDSKGRWGVYLITKFLVTCNNRRKLLHRDESFRNLTAYAHGYAEARGLTFQEVV